MLNEKQSIRTDHGCVATDAENFQLLTHAEDVHVLIVDDKSHISITRVFYWAKDISLWIKQNRDFMIDSTISNGRLLLIRFVLALSFTLEVH